MKKIVFLVLALVLAFNLSAEQRAVFGKFFVTSKVVNDSTGTTTLYGLRDKGGDMILPYTYKAINTSPGQNGLITMLHKSGETVYMNAEKDIFFELKSLDEARDNKEQTDVKATNLGLWLCILLWPLVLMIIIIYGCFENVGRWIGWGIVIIYFGACCYCWFFSPPNMLGFTKTKEYVEQNSKYGLVDKNGNEVVPLKFSYITNFDENMLIGSIDKKRRLF